ncbi:hypothetical protein GALMADRAFT_239435 [Galerina marginata CBS 339.88]|uniref:Alpha-ketoglutarate-dependent dioxygenase AlkB-like domain-containing protein n=1 Tax=Galerina marginata (strain CBS 339.88) TaxID=685588 RepID=A0A067TED2_GALM3|nr:hypothetical protein GALMADRAFT_239435 [Galerina marginata CBS 339.88]
MSGLRCSFATSRSLALMTKFRHQYHISQPQPYPQGFSFWPNYFSDTEQKTLLAASLHKLDQSETRRARRRRKEYWDSKLQSLIRLGAGSPASLFAPDDMYEFQEGHFDGVIHHFREMHLSSWPIEQFQDLSAILIRLYSLCPTKDIQTHILHLASYGSILPHVDNVNSSGAWILGVSLGGERVLRMQKVPEGGENFSLNLPSGSVYLQRDQVRYNYLHSIARKSREGAVVDAEQRLSIMIRDQNAYPSSY